MEKPLVISVEDSKDDRLFLRRAFRKGLYDVSLVSFNDAQEAIHYLQGAIAPGPRRGNTLPSAIVIDLTLPGVNGFELIEWIRAQPALKEMVIGVLSGSDMQSDMVQALKLGAGFYLKKPIRLHDYEHVADQVMAHLPQAHVATN